MLGGDDSVAHFITVIEQSQSNRDCSFHSSFAIWVNTEKYRNIVGLYLLNLHQNFPMILNCLFISTLMLTTSKLSAILLFLNYMYDNLSFPYFNFLLHLGPGVYTIYKWNPLVSIFSTFISIFLVTVKYLWHTSIWKNLNIFIVSFDLQNPSSAYSCWLYIKMHLHKFDFVSVQWFSPRSQKLNFQSKPVHLLSFILIVLNVSEI